MNTCILGAVLATTMTGLGFKGMLCLQELLLGQGRAVLTAGLVLLGRACCALSTWRCWGKDLIEI